MSFKLPNYKLYYFNARGRAEIARLLLVEKNIPFEDIRLNKEQWAEKKNSTPTGQLPYMEINGEPLSESMAIVRYLAREHGVYGNNNLAMAQVDEILDWQEDVIKELMPGFMEQDPEKKKAMLKEVLTKKYAAFVSRLEDKLGKNKSGYLVGESLTIADISVFNLWGYLANSVPELWDKSPKCKALYQKVGSHPNIKAWIEQHPDDYKS